MDFSQKPQAYTGMEAVSPYDAPEVVPGSEPRVPVEHIHGMNSPQIWTPPAQEKQQYDYYSGQQETHPYYEPEKRPLEERDGEKTAINDSRRTKMCGMRPKVFFWALGAIIFVLVIAAVLGGVLGTVLNDSSSSDSQSNTPASSSSGPKLAITADTGLAVLKSEGSSTTYQYYQDYQGRIIENRYDNGKWSIQPNDSPPAYSIIGNDAQAGSPIAATSWLSSGTLFRQVFYLDQSGRIMSSNTTGINVWPTSYNILPDDSAMPDTKALAVCSDTDSDALNGIRVYFASSDLGYIREVGMDFSGKDSYTWTLWAEFPGSDPRSGVATLLADTTNHLYLISSSNVDLEQWTWDYANVTSWYRGVQGNSYVAGETDIAAVYDGTSTDHIFYQGEGGKLTRALYYGQEISDLKQLDKLAEGSKISALYDDSNSNNGATVFYQPASDPKQVYYETINRNGELLQTDVVQ